MADDLQYLFEDIYWRGIFAHFERSDAPPPDELISNVNVVPLIGDRYVVIRLEDGRYEIPGGTLEEGEKYLEAAQRELIEEAGARLLNFTPFGAWRAHSTVDKPYRPYLPHPDYFRLVGYGDVELISQPTNPDGAEQVAAVEVVTLDEAAARFTASARPDLADLYRLAARVREGTA